MYLIRKIIIYGKTAAAYVNAKRVESYDFSFVPDHSDYYYFVLDNTYSWFTNKVPEITATWSYTIATTEYKTVTETKEVWLRLIFKDRETVSNLIELMNKKRFSSKRNMSRTIS